MPMTAVLSPGWRGRLRRGLLAPLLAAAIALSASMPAAAAECFGDECQAPPAAPDDPMPGTAVAIGPPDPPVRFPKSQRKKRHHQKNSQQRQANRQGRR
jgi:hypothetical protein